MSDEYLWDKTGTPDAEIVRLERLLSEFRLPTGCPPWERVAPAGPRRYALRLLAAAAVLAALGASTFLFWPGRTAPPPERRGAGWGYELTRTARDPAAPPTRQERFLPVGGWIETDARSRADLTVADIGHVSVAPGSRLRLMATGQTEHRLRLERGRMTAVVSAPPRLFVTETPAGSAVDLGCRYTLEVDAEGNGALTVEQGVVLFERGGEAAYTPGGARCTSRRKAGLGTPHFETASPALRAALEALDFGPADAGSLRAVLDACLARDTLTLWNLLSHPRLDASARGRVLDRIEDFVELPPALTRANVIAGERETLGRLRSALALHW